MSAPFFPTRRRPIAAFTLVEVILAIVIALGVLVLLYFYQQATNLRSQAIQETERLAAARLVMDRITGELGTLRSQSSARLPLSGGSNFIEFVRADVPSFATWNGGALGRSPVPITDLKRVSYRLQSTDGTNVAGLLRSEEPMVLRAQASLNEEDSETNSMANARPEFVLEEIRFLQFRYWSGTNWLDSWSQSSPPAGVEVWLGAEPATNGMELADYPGDIFRRVISLQISQLAEDLEPSLGQDPSSSGDLDLP